MAQKCSPLLLSPSSIPSYDPPSPVLSLQPPSPPPVLSVDSRRLLVSAARRKDTASLRERWRQKQATRPVTSHADRLYPQSAPFNMVASSGTALAQLRKRLKAYGYGTSDESDVPRTRPPLQFPLLEQEVKKGNLTQRLPYHVKVEVESKRKMDYPSHRPSYSQVFFFPAQQPPRTPSPPHTPRPRSWSTRQERFFIHPEWASEAVGWQRFVHSSTPDRFHYSWM